MARLASLWSARRRGRGAIACLAPVVLLALGAGACTQDSDPGADDGRDGLERVESLGTTTTSPRLVAPDLEPIVTPDATFDLRCRGNGLAPVILVPGTGADATRWDDFIDDVGQEVLVCRFETSPAEQPTAGRSPATEAEGLAQVIEASDFPGPVVLVGHSLGGVTVRRFGDLHPDLLAGALLLDPTTPLALLSVHDELEADGWDVPTTEADANAPAEWPDVPLTVLSHDPGLLTLGDAAVEDLWTEGQQAYAALTPQGTATVVEGSGHVIDADAPMRVIQVIDDLVAAAAPGN